MSKTLTTLALVLLLGALGPFHAVAGTFLYRACYRNDSAIFLPPNGVPATGFAASLPQGGLFFGVTGSFAMNQNGFCIVPNVGNVIPNQRLAPKPTLGVAFLPNVTINPGSYFVLSTTRNGDKTFLNPPGGFFTSALGPLLPPMTAGASAVVSAEADPEVDVTNTGASSLTITGFEAFVNNSEDPLNLATDFVPDGTPIDVTNSGGLNLISGDTAIFDFVLPANVGNWAFEVSYTSSDGSFSQLVATDVPEPSSLMLLSPGIWLLAVYVRRRIWKAV